MIILVGQVGLLLTSALHQTPADGNPVLSIYLFLVILSVFILIPTTPFMHRTSSLVPFLLFVVFVGTLLYNLFAFPFSDHSRLKVYFVQSVDLDTGLNQVSLTGLNPYLEQIIQQIPSASGKFVNCTNPDYSARAGLEKCSWQGLPPNIVPQPKHSTPNQRFKNWLRFNATRRGDLPEATFHISGQNTRACRLLFDRPITNFTVKGYSTDPRFSPIREKGCTSIRLWSREWGGSWDVNVSWNEPGGMDGRVVCLWSDANNPNTIPAFDEALRFVPRWSIVTKLSDGLVEGFRSFKV